MTALHVTAELLLGLLAYAMPEHWRRSRHAVGLACVVNARRWAKYQLTHNPLYGMIDP